MDISLSGAPQNLRAASTLHPLVLAPSPQTTAKPGLWMREVALCTVLGLAEACPGEDQEVGLGFPGVGLISGEAEIGWKVLLLHEESTG